MVKTVKKRGYNRRSKRMNRSRLSRNKRPQTTRKKRNKGKSNLKSNRKQTTRRKRNDIKYSLRKRTKRKKSKRKILGGAAELYGPKTKEETLSQALEMAKADLKNLENQPRLSKAAWQVGFRKGKNIQELRGVIDKLDEKLKREREPDKSSSFKVGEQKEATEGTAVPATTVIAPIGNLLENINLDKYQTILDKVQSEKFTEEDKVKLEALAKMLQGQSVEDQSDSKMQKLQGYIIKLYGLLGSKLEGLAIPIRDKVKGLIEKLVAKVTNQAEEQKGGGEDDTVSDDTVSDDLLNEVEKMINYLDSINNADDVENVNIDESVNEINRILQEEDSDESGTEVQEPAETKPLDQSTEEQSTEEQSTEEQSTGTPTTTETEERSVVSEGKTASDGKAAAEAKTSEEKAEAEKTSEEKAAAEKEAAEKEAAEKAEAEKEAAGSSGEGSSGEGRSGEARSF